MTKWKDIKAVLTSKNWNNFTPEQKKIESKFSYGVLISLIFLLVIVPFAYDPDGIPTIKDLGPIFILLLFLTSANLPQRKYKALKLNIFIPLGIIIAYGAILMRTPPKGIKLLEILVSGSMFFYYLQRAIYYLRKLRVSTDGPKDIDQKQKLNFIYRVLLVGILTVIFIAIINSALRTIF